MFFLPTEENQTRRGAPQAGGRAGGRISAPHRTAPLLPARPGPAPPGASAARRPGGKVKFPPRWWRHPRCAAPAPHWHRAPGRSAAAAARTMCVRGEQNGAGARPAGGRGTRPGPAPRPPAAPDRWSPLPPPSGWAAAPVNQAPQPARRGLAVGRSLGRWRRVAVRGAGRRAAASPRRATPPPHPPAACAPLPPGAAVISSSPLGAASLLPALQRPFRRSSPHAGRGEGPAAAALQAPAAARPLPSARSSPRLQGGALPAGAPGSAAALAVASALAAEAAPTRHAGWEITLALWLSRGLRAAARLRERGCGCCRRKGPALQVRRQGEPLSGPLPTGKAQRRTPQALPRAELPFAALRGGPANRAFWGRKTRDCCNTVFMTSHSP